MFEPLTKIIAYTFTFMILAVAICFGLVLYINSIPQENSLIAKDIIAPKAIELNEQQQLGKQLFKANCATCHKPIKKSVGPPLAGVSQKRDAEWIYSWVANPQAKIDSGDAYAIKIYKEYNQTSMNAFPQLSTTDIDAILAYADTYK